MREKMSNGEIGLNLYDAAYIVSYGNIPVKRVCESESGRFLQVFDDTPLHKLLIEKACNQQLERYISAMNQLRGIFLSHMREKRCNSILPDSQMLYGNKEER